MGANHAHGHSDGPAVSSSRATMWATLAVIVPLALVTLTAEPWQHAEEPTSSEPVS
ncbi:hypothetical protein [Streptosporangium subroseum]|uniref:hypothetical protein n=1 Tax=Streptosporangium subroseum TaxID=106412 RepID=UPI003084FA4B|nr:hypothetical protein OHB15_24000 [Streptosporangium subroseum]